jgi:hypothetical protein
MPFIFKKPEWEGGRPKKNLKTHNQPMAIWDNRCRWKWRRGENGEFAGELRDF